MSREQKPPDITTSRDRQSSRGRTMDHLTSKPYRADSEDTELTKMNNHETVQSQKKEYVIAGSRRPDKRMISKDKSSTCDRTTQDGQSCRMPVADSTGTGKILEPFYNGHCKEMSRRLRLHIETEWPGSDSKLSSTCWHKEEFESSATHMTTINPRKKSSSTISFQLSPSSVQKYTEGETTKTGKQTRMRSIQLFPTPVQRRVLKKWFGDCRHTYNTCVLYERNHGIKTKRSQFQWLRNRFVTNKNIPDAKKWLKDTPKHIREGSVKDFVTARKAAFTNLRNGNIRRFGIGLRRKEDHQSILIPKDFLKTDDSPGIMCYPTFLKGKLLTRCKVPPIVHDCRLVYKNKSFFLQVPIDIETSDRASLTTDFCAIDPGERTFVTTWSDRGVSEFGTMFGARMFSRLVAMDKLRSKIDMEKDGRKKRRKKDAFGRLSQRMHNILKDFHYKVASSLCDEYNNIIIPIFGTKDMISKKNRRLKTKTVRQMTCLGHAKFRERLLNVASRRGKNIFHVTEEYTSKTCCACGCLNEKLGGSRTFRCGDCGFTASRDIHGAFNIFLKFMKEHSATIVAEEHQR
jgi:putative transposase